MQGGDVNSYWFKKKKEGGMLGGITDTVAQSVRDSSFWIMVPYDTRTSPHSRADWLVCRQLYLD